MDFRIAPVSKNLMIINALLWLLAEVLLKTGIDLDDTFALHVLEASDFHWYQMLTSMFLHTGFMHLLYSELAILWFGSIMENLWGSRKFFFYYIFCGVGAAITNIIAQHIYHMYIMGLEAHKVLPLVGGGYMPVSTYLNYITSNGASGCIYGLLLAFGLYAPITEMFVFPIPFPVKPRWMVVGYAAFELAAGITARGGDNVAHFAHLGGMLFGLLIILYWKKYGDYRLPLGLEPLINENCPKERNIFSKIKNLFAGREKRDFKVHKNESFSEKKTEKRQQPRPKRDPEIDAILKKVRESGYDSLTTEEKRKLFNGY